MKNWEKMNSYVFIVLVKDNLSSKSQCYCKSHHIFPKDLAPSIFPSNFMSFPASATEELPRAPASCFTVQSRGAVHRVMMCCCVCRAVCSEIRNVCFGLIRL